MAGSDTCNQRRIANEELAHFIEAEIKANVEGRLHLQGLGLLYIDNAAEIDIEIF